jgi:hypothetical protein
VAAAAHLGGVVDEKEETAEELPASGKKRWPG